MIVVATPVAQWPSRFAAVAEFAPPTALITDAGSTKAVLVRELDEALPAKHALRRQPSAGRQRKDGPRSRPCPICSPAGW